MQEETRALLCSHCGGELGDGARSCPYCRTAVFTRRCAACFHVSLPDADHCQACGRALGLEPVPEPATLRCPACHGPFDAVATGSGAPLYDCAACGGQFLGHAVLRALLEERVRLPAGAPESRPPASVRAAPVRYLPCPVCGVLMNRKNFGDHSGVIVDVCRGHGIWFDAGELPRVFAFVERGGLEQAAAREAVRERERRLAERMDRVGVVKMHAASDADVRNALDAAVIEALAGLLRWLRH